MKHKTLGSLLLWGVGFIASLGATPIQWTLGSGGNGHYYDYVSAGIFDGITFEAARTGAEASTYMGMTGYLATITSAAENTFLIDAFSYVYGFGGNPGTTAYIGATDGNTDGIFRWIGGPEAGQTLNYTNFNGGAVEEAGVVNQLVFFRFLAQNNANGTWLIYNSSNRALGYLIEYSGTSSPTSGVPEPGTWAMAATALLPLGLGAWRRARQGYRQGQGSAAGKR